MTDVLRDSDGFPLPAFACRACDGTGYVMGLEDSHDDVCAACEGSGVAPGYSRTREVVTDVVVLAARREEQQDPGAGAYAVLAFLARYRNKQTRYSYGLALEQWFAWCTENNVEPLSANRVHIELFARELEATGRQLSTVAIKLNALAGYYRFAVADGLIEKDPMVHVLRPQIQRESTTVGLTRPELADLVKVAEGSSPLDHAVVLILAYNGLRAGELAGIDIEHLGRHKGAPTVTIIRKYGKRQVIPFAYPTAWAIERLLAVHSTGTGPLFLTAEGNRMDRKGFGRILKRLYLAAKIPKRAHPHALRHTFVTLARDAGESDRDIMASTGHGDARMLEYYDRARDNIERNVTHGVAAFVERAT